MTKKRENNPSSEKVSLQGNSEGLVFFRYDKTFEGLLTCVFDAYNRKIFPQKLLDMNEVEPLFAQEIHIVTTDEKKSARVWKGLEKKLTKYGCNMITHVWLSEEPHSDELIFRYICKVYNSKQSIETNFSDADVLEMNQLAKKVSQERQRILMFVRFQKTANGMFFAPIAPIHNALPLAVEHFIDRFADQKWIIYDTKRNYGYYYDLKTATEMTLDNQDNFLDGKLRESLMAEDEKLFQELWKGYFKSMTIKERINPKLHRQFLPIRFWKYLTEKQK